MFRSDTQIGKYQNCANSEQTPGIFATIQFKTFYPVVSGLKLQRLIYIEHSTINKFNLYPLQSCLINLHVTQVKEYPTFMLVTDAS
jgi:hypothetical protein